MSPDSICLSVQSDVRTCGPHVTGGKRRNCASQTPLASYYDWLCQIWLEVWCNIIWQEPDLILIYKWYLYCNINSVWTVCEEDELTVLRLKHINWCSSKWILMCLKTHKYCKNSAACTQFKPDKLRLTFSRRDHWHRCVQSRLCQSTPGKLRLHL